MWTGLLVVARTAYAGETEDTVTMTSSDVNWIAGTTEVRYGLPRLRTLCDALDYTLATPQRGAGAALAPSRHRASDSPVRRQYRVTIRNFQRKQWPYSAESRSKKKKKNEEDEEESLPRGTRKRAPSEDAVKFAQDYLDALKRTGNLRRNVTEKTLAEWTIQADRMLRRDGVSLDEARSLCAWIFRSEDDEAHFWRATARSVRNFRRNYDQINAQRERAKKGGRRGGDVRSAIARVAERHGA